MRVQCTAIVFLVTIMSTARAQTPCVGRVSVLSADTASFLLHAPAGWILDCHAGRNQGALTVLYREGESWRTGTAVMYASTLTDRNTRPLAFAKRVEEEVTEWRGKAPDVRVAVLPALVTGRGSGARASVRQFVSPAEHLFEIVAYVPRGRVMPLVVMTARTQKAFNAALPAFRQLVKSYDVASLKIVP